MGIKADEIAWDMAAPREQEAERRVFRERGEGKYSLEILPLGLTFEVDRIRRDRDGMVGELVVSVSNGHFPSARTYNNVLSIGDLNFSAVRSRTERANLLSKRSGAEHLDWFGYLEEFCVRTMETERKGKPAVVLADIDPKEDKVEEWMVGDFPVLAELPMVIFGDAASGKSYFAMWIAGQLAKQDIGVMYVDWELSELEHRKRLGRLFDPMPRNVHYVRCEYPLSQQTDRLQRIAEEKKCRYAICDSIGFAVDGAAEAQESALRYFRSLRQLRMGTLNLAHIPKQYDDNREAQIFGCYSADTEVLTDSGWKSHADIRDSDTVLAWDLNTETYDWERPIAIHAYDYKGQMIHLRTSTTDALVTPNHRCVVRTPAYKTGSGRKVGVGAWRFVEAKDLTRQLEVPLAADLMSEVGDTQLQGGDDWIRLIGWWVAEGSNHGAHSFSLAQAVDSPLTPRMLASLDRLGIAYTKTLSKFKARPHEKEMCYIISKRSAKPLAEWLRRHCGSDGAATKRLPDLAWALSKRQKQVLLEALIDGDGSRLTYGGCLYHTVSRQLADDVQRLAIECGHPASIRWDPPGKVWHYPRGSVKISREKRRTLSLYRRHATPVSYEGKVFCLTVPSGAYVTRRGGKMAIYGNSTFFKAGARSAWFVDKASVNPKDEIRFGLHHRKSNIGPLLGSRGYRLVFEGKRSHIASIDIKSVDELQTSLPLVERVKIFLLAGPQTPKAICDDLGVPIGSLRNVFSRHKAMFVKMGNKYGIVAEGVDF